MPASVGAAIGRLSTPARPLALLAALALLCRCASAGGPPPVNLQVELGIPDRGACATLVTVFTTWCFTCLGQLEVLRGLAPELMARGLDIQAVAMDLEGEKVVGPFAEQSRLPFPVRLPSDLFREGKSSLGPVTGVPRSFLIGPRGERLGGIEGVASPEQLKKALAPYLAKERATDLKRFSCP